MTIKSLPTHILATILSMSSTDENCPFLTGRLVSKEWKAKIDNVLSNGWKKLEGKLPSKELHSNFTSINTMRIETLEKFQKLANKSGMRARHFFDPYEFAEVVKNNDKALVSLWNMIRFDLGEDKSITNLPIYKACAKEIREFLYQNLDKLTQIKKISLNRCNLRIIPDEIRLFPNLETLDLSSNQLDHLPDWIADLKQLTSINLSRNKFTEIPSVTFDLYECNLSDNLIEEIPSWKHNPSSLKKLNLSGNKIKTIPEEFEIHESLEELNLSRTSFEEIPLLLTKMIKLKKVIFHDNPLKSLPKNLNTTLFSLINCKSYESNYRVASPLGSLYQAIIKGKKQVELKFLTAQLEPNDLHLLYEMVSKWSGCPQGDPKWGEHNLFKVEPVIFFYTVKTAIEEKFGRLSDEEKEEITKLTCILRGVKKPQPPLINLCALADALDQKTVNLINFFKGVQETFPLKLEHPPVTVTEIENWFLKKEVQSCLAKMKTLVLGNLKLTALPAQILYFKELNQLILNNNSLSEFPESIISLEKLTDINLGNNIITKIPSSIEKLHELNDLNLCDNQIEVLPEEIGRLTNLTYFSITTKNIAQLPLSFFNLTKLVSIHLYGSIQQIPHEIKNLINLRWFDFIPDFIESISPEICLLPNIKQAWIAPIKTITIEKETIKIVSGSVEKHCVDHLRKVFNFAHDFEIVAPLPIKAKLPQISVDPILENRNFLPCSPLGSLYYKSNDRASFIKQLEKQDYFLLCEMIWKCAGCPEGDEKWGENHLYRVTDKIFFKAIEKTIQEKYLGLSEEKKKEISGATPNHHIFYCYPLLADALSLSDEDFVKGTCFNPKLYLSKEFQPLLKTHGRLVVLGILRWVSSNPESDIHKQLKSSKNKSIEAELNFLKTVVEGWQLFSGNFILNKIDALGKPSFIWSNTDSGLPNSKNGLFYYEKETKFSLPEIKDAFESKKTMAVAFTFFKKTLPLLAKGDGCYYRNAWIQRVLLDYFGVRSTSVRLVNPFHEVYSWRFHIAPRVTYKTSNGSYKDVMFDVLLEKVIKADEWKNKFLKQGDTTTTIEEKTVEETLKEQSTRSIIAGLRGLFFKQIGTLTLSNN